MKDWRKPLNITNNSHNTLCTVCGKHTTEPILSSYRSIPYRYCCNCKCVYLADESNINPDLYTDDYLGNTKCTAEHIKTYGGIFNYLYESIKIAIDKDCGTFLEIGFGNPGVLAYANKAGFKCTGIDLSLPDSMKKALNKIGITTIKGNFINVEIEDTFDVIWMSHFVEHFKPKCLIAEIIPKVTKLLNPDGVIAIITPDASLYGTQYDELFYGNCKNNEHYVIYDVDAFSDHIMKPKGFTRYWKSRYVEGKKFHTKGEWRSFFGKKFV